MMGIPPSEAKRLTWWEYSALMAEWNARHAPPEAEAEVEAPTAEQMEASARAAAAMGLIQG